MVLVGLMLVMSLKYKIYVMFVLLIVSVIVFIYVFMFGIVFGKVVSVKGVSIMLVIV